MTNEVTGVNQTDYMKLFTQELTYQDPLKPIDNREFMSQMAQFSALQEAQASGNTLKDILEMTAGNTSLMLLGKSVKINGSNEAGQVVKVNFATDGLPQLSIRINGGTVTSELANITEVW